MTPDNEGESGGQGTENTQASEGETAQAPQGETAQASQDHVSLKAADSGVQAYPPPGYQNPFVSVGQSPAAPGGQPDGQPPAQLAPASAEGPKPSAADGGGSSSGGEASGDG